VGAGRLAPFLGASSDRPRWPPGFLSPEGADAWSKSLLRAVTPRDAGRALPRAFTVMPAGCKIIGVAAAPGKHVTAYELAGIHRSGPIESSQLTRRS